MTRRVSVESAAVDVVRLEAVHEEAVLRAARSHPATSFNLNYADPDGQAVALCLRDLLLRAGWSQLSDAGPAPGFARRGVIVWAPADKMRIAEALAPALRGLFAVSVVERNDGGPVAVTVGVATWSTARGLLSAR
jgi:hypothetical protein